MGAGGHSVDERQRPPVTVVVCTHQRPDCLPDCLSSIAASMSADDELILVESGDSRGGDALASLPTSVRRHRFASTDRRKSVMLNRAVRAAANELLVLTDDDCRVAPGWITGMAAAFSDPHAGVAFGPVSGLDSAPGGQPAPVLPPGPAPVENWNFAHGASMAVRRTAVVDAGGFDERLGPGARTHGEEADMILRMSEAGWGCVVADAPKVRHLAWRDAPERRANLTVYERGAGAWLGAGLRRSPRRVAKVLVLRLAYQGGLWRDRRTRGAWYGPQMTLAFLGGLLRGLTYRPRRWL